MKALIVDDEQSNIQNLSTLLNTYCPRVIIAGSANTVKNALEKIGSEQPDLIFLDIQLGLQSGFDLLKQLPTKDFEVIFVTAFDKYGIEAIKFAALDYLLKPVEIPELVLAVNKAEDKLMAKQKTQQLNFLLSHLKNEEAAPAKIALPQLHEIRYVAISDIIRCEADNSYTLFYLANNDKIMVSRSIKEYSELLKPIGFLRTHQSHLVNSLFVKSWIKEDGGTLLLTNGDKIPVSKPNKATVQSTLNKHLR
ncbi:LytR/AlgR family response regulator transcription factor [Pedobacter psychroterrae]|uniref:Response regulator transcription factor n=1 Tax=Pedobacter psychroterrae TaxID=2530453 RepID=A0A4R0NVA0_9SPHI|nr:LytTR family DNA-binding domain-containing protein [Pedobacter psychroterrae]TCD02964.1 response regulator transcription factor [Pedobacter psychroterrae]